MLCYVITKENPENYLAISLKKKAISLKKKKKRKNSVKGFKRNLASH